MGWVTHGRQTKEQVVPIEWGIKTEDGGTRRSQISKVLIFVFDGKGLQCKLTLIAF